MKIANPVITLLTAIIVLNNCPKSRAARENIQPSPIKSVPIGQVHITDEFWLPKLKVYNDQTIGHGWAYLESVIDTAKEIASGAPLTPMKTGRWHESNLHKHLEAVAYALHQFPDQALKARLDSVINLYASAQRQDGYFYLWGMSRGLPPWSNIMLQHEDFCAGHLYEAAAFHSRLFDDSFLKIAEKSALHTYKLFIEEKSVTDSSGHAGIELGLVELYRATGNRKYLELAMNVIERKGKGLNGWDCERSGFTNLFFPCEYYQDHLPFDKQTKLRGHAVRAVYFLTGIVDVAIETGKKEYIEAAKRLWHNVTTRKTCVTGSIGALYRGEALGDDYELPRDSYNESCAACGMANCAAKMLRLEPDSKHADVLENVLYNGILHGIALDGKNFFYQNPLSGSRRRENQWVCCPPNLSRTLLGIGRYIYTQSDNELFVNLYLGNESRVKLKSAELNMSISGNYAWKGEVVIKPQPTAIAEFTLNLRIPGWCEKYQIYLNGKSQKDVHIKNGYAVLKRKWNKTDTVQLAFAMPVRRLQPNPKIYEQEPWVRSFKNEVALQRGPFVYAIEGIDNHDTTDITISKTPDFKTAFQPNLLNGIVMITGNTAGGTTFTAIPYYALANRDKSQTEVWIKQQAKTSNTGGDWEDTLYRKYQP